MSVNRQEGGLLLGFAALATLFVTMQPKPAEHSIAKEGEKRREEAKASLRDAGPSEGPVPDGPTKPIWDFLALAPAKAETRTTRYAVELSRNGAVVTEETAGPEAAAKLYDWPACCDLEGFTFRFLIATVPDPFDSGFGYAFDQVVEAVQRAVEADDYVIDRAWLPWRRAASGRPADPRLHERHPGLVLFRDDNPPTKASQRGGRLQRRLLALLLVGETATAGINRFAFRNAVRVIHSCPGHKEEGNRIRVLGPHFSGSAVSLGLALQETRKIMEHMPRGEKPREPWIKVVCGSASGFIHHDFVKTYDEDGWRGDPKDEEEPAFATTILPNDLLLRWARKYLGNPADPVHGKSPAPIVVLHEANTSFGQFSIDLNMIGKGKQTGDNDQKIELFLIPFPLHISQLRASYTKEQMARAESQGLPRSGRNLPFPSEDQDKGEAGQEAIAVQNPLMTAAIDDLVLGNLVTTMAQKRTNYACLVSTDVRDTIFLAQEIRNHQRDVQLVTLGSDLLLTHEDYNYALHGMVVASTYPLYPSVQGWSDVARDRRYSGRILFAQEAYQGCYNAALVHLADKQKERTQAEKLTSLMMDYGWEGTRGDVTMPPLWISVVGGNGQMVPVTYIAPKEYAPCDDSLQYLYQRKRAPSAPNRVSYGRLTPPNMWFFSFAVFLVVNVCFFYRVCYYLGDSCWGVTVADRAARYKQRIDFAVGCLAQVLLYGMMAELTCTPLRAGLWTQDRLVAFAVGLVLLASVLMVAAAWVMLIVAHCQEFEGFALKRRWDAYVEIFRGSATMRGWPRWLGWPSRGGSWIAVSDLAMLAVVTFAVVGFAWRIFFSATGDFQPQKMIQFERTVHLSNGVSPLLPRVFFCAALFGWSFFLVKKLHLANHYSVESPFPCNGSASFNGLRGLHRAVHSELMPPSTLQKHFGWCLLTFGLVLIGFIKLAYDAAWPIDGVGFGRWASIGFCAGSFLLLFTLLQFHFAWRSLRKLLRFVALLPMQNAFERLSDKVVGIFGHYLYSLRPRHSHLGINVQQFHRVRRLFLPFRVELQRAAQSNLPLGQLDPATLGAAWQEVQIVFPNLVFGPPVAQQFDQELNPVVEEDMEPPAGSSVLEWGGVTGEDIHQLTRRCLRVLYPFWSIHSMEEAFGRAPQTGESAEHAAGTPNFLSLPEGDALREWIVAAEDFVAIEIIRYLSQFIVQLRNLLTCLTLGSLLLVLAATVYPFSAQYQLLLFLTALAGGIALFILTFLVQLNRDELVSRITRSTPNRFTPDWSFLHGATAYVLPILAGLMVQFPLVTSTLRSLLDPLFHIIK